MRESTFGVQNVLFLKLSGSENSNKDGKLLLWNIPTIEPALSQITLSLIRRRKKNALIAVLIFWSLDRSLCLAPLIYPSVKVRISPTASRLPLKAQSCSLTPVFVFVKKVALKNLLIAASSCLRTSANTFWLWRCFDPVLHHAIIGLPPSHPPYWLQLPLIYPRPPHVPLLELISIIIVWSHQCTLILNTGLPKAPTSILLHLSARLHLS